MIIGLASLKPQVGKTTVAYYLQDKYNYEPVEMSSPISWIAKRFFGFTDKAFPEDRKLLQDIGLAAKEKDPNIWFYYCLFQAELNYKSRSITDLILSFSYPALESFRNKVESEGLKSAMPNFFESTLEVSGTDFEGGYLYRDRVPAQGVLMGGVRSPFEADEILKVGGKVYLIENDRVKLPEGEHAVESQLKDYCRFTGVINNDGSFDELYSNVDSAVGNDIDVIDNIIAEKERIKHAQEIKI